MTIKIELLNNNPAALPTLVGIWHEVLGSIWAPDLPIIQVEQRFMTHLNRDSLPLTYVVYKEDIPVAMGSLRENDGIRPDLKPWLGSLVVSPNYQKKGIAKLLIDKIKQQAIFLGFTELFLFTFDSTLPNYYQRQGFNFFAMDHFRGHSVTVMRTDLK